MLLVIDIGNSSITTGIFAGDHLLDRLEIPTRPQGDPGLYRRELEKLLSGKNVEKPLGVIISSVVPELTDALARSVKEISLGEPLTVDCSLDTGLTFDVERPEEIGADRIVNAVAAVEAFGSPVAVVDFGTATTISAVRDSRFLGGAILPGLRLMGEALHRGTSKLPAVELAPEWIAGPSGIRALGKNTIQCIISGIIYGTAWAVEGIIGAIEKEEGCILRVVVTGGYSEIMARFMKRECSIEPDLTLKGLRMLYERNS